MFLSFLLEREREVLMYIDLLIISSIFFLWNGTDFELIEFIDNLNKKHPTIKFNTCFSNFQFCRLVVGVCT